MISSLKRRAAKAGLLDRIDARVVPTESMRLTDLTGKVAQETLDRANLTCNKNTVPFDTASPFVTSGIRIGTSAITTRGMGEAEARLIGQLILKVLDAPEDASVLQGVQAEVRALTDRFPIYAD